MPVGHSTNVDQKDLSTGNKADTEDTDGYCTEVG